LTNDISLLLAIISALLISDDDEIIKATSVMMRNALTGQTLTNIDLLLT